jgi:hypothetical protein
MGESDVPTNPPSGSPQVTPPVGQPEREGWNSHRGYVYQVWYAIRQWLALTPGEVLFLEHAEDTARTNAKGIELAQVRQVVAPISLGTEPARVALCNFWQHASSNQRKVTFQYITTGTVNREQGHPFGHDETGIATWGKAQSDLAAASKIHQYLKGDPKHLSAELVDFLSKSTAEEIQQRLIKPFSWNAGHPSLEELRKEVARDLYDFAAKLAPPLPLAEDELAIVSSVLFDYATTASTTRELRRLDQQQLTDRIDRTMYEKKKRRFYAAERQSDDGAIVLSPSESVIDWKEPSKELESWPQTLSNGYEIERPEFKIIEDRILESTKSASLILGEPGAGKSALLAKLSSSLSARGIRHLSIKADGIPKGIKSLDELVKNLGSKSLFDAVKETASQEKFVVLVDQLDGLCSLVDVHTERLNLLLALLQRLGELPQIHIVASCRNFEYQTDTRLQTLRAHEIALKLPAWDEISPLVLDENGAPAKVADSLREVLCVPWQLKLFLDLPQPRPALTSPYDLLTHIWTKKVLRADAPQHCGELVELIAKRISKSEEFWIPEVVATKFPDALNYLIGEGILKQTDDLRSIGFRHQTFYDYFILRTFLSEGTTLIEYIKGRDQSFFVRPTFVRALAYLRSNEHQEYVRTITDLLQGNYLRIHLKTLLMEFIGQWAEPFPEEQRLILPLLKDDKPGQTVLRVVVGSPGWFKAILATDFEQRWMGSGWSNAVHTVSFLTSALPFDEAKVGDLIANQWLNKPDHDRLAFNVLGSAKNWKGRLVECVQKYSERRTLDEMTCLLRQFIKTNPAVGSEVFGALLVKEAAKYAEEEAKRPPLTPAEAAMAFPPRSPVAKAIKELLHGQNFHRLGLQKMAEAAPAAFLRHAWPPIREMVLLAGVEYKREDPTCYPRDFVELKLRDNGDRSDDLLWAIQAGLKALARTDPNAFLEWVAKETSTEFLPMHRLIARGMIDLDTKFSDDVITYLLGDRRRLNLGYYKDETAETTDLLKKFSGTCSRRFFTKLVKQIVALPVSDYPLWKNIRPDSTTRSRVKRTTRLERFELLSSLPLRRIDEHRRILLRQERHRYGGVADRRRLDNHVVSFGGGGLSLPQLEVLDDSAITTVLGRCTDQVDGNPMLGTREELQSMIFGLFAAKHPQRALLQIPHLHPNVHERYATQLVMKLADPRAPNTNGNVQKFPPVIPGAQIEALVRDFNAKGFSSSFFREQAAMALEHLCHSQPGLAEETIQMLLSWLNHAEADAEEPDDEDTKESKIPDTSVLYSGSTLLSRPSGRMNFIGAIVEGLLSQSPSAVERCFDFLDRLAITERRPGIWADVVFQTAYLNRGHSQRFTKLFSTLVASVPRFLSCPSTTFAWANIAGFTNPVTDEQAWFANLLEKNFPYFRQIAGELLFLIHANGPTDWSKDKVNKSLRGELGDYFLQGLAYAAAAHICCPPVRDLTADVLTTGLLSQNEKVVGAAWTLCNHIRVEGWNDTSKRMVLALLDAKDPLSHDLSVLCHQLEPIVASDPDTCFAVCQKIVEKFAARLADPSDNLSSAAEDIINIALTVQRFGHLRQPGLELFEKLLEMNVSEAMKAANLLNDRPGTKA